MGGGGAERWHRIERAVSGERSQCSLFGSGSLQCCLPSPLRVATCYGDAVATFELLLLLRIPLLRSDDSQTKLA